MPKWTRRQATANINRVMRRACGHALAHTPLRVTSSACPRKQPMAYKAHMPSCATHPHAQSQDEHRNHHDIATRSEYNSLSYLRHT